MARIEFTHSFDLLHKIGNIAGSLIIFSAANDLISPITDLVKKTINNSGYEWVGALLFIAYFIAGMIASVILLNKTIWPTWLPTYLYVRLLLRTPISTSEAEKISFLFDGSLLQGQWYPLKAIKKITKEYRREALLRFANSVSNSWGGNKLFDMDEDKPHKNKRNEKSDYTYKNNSQESPAQESIVPSEFIYSLRILGLKELPSSFEIIKQAYRRKIREFHPDKFSGEKNEILVYA